ncbi:MAG: KdsC family phosphatase [bacterium]
MVEKKAEKIKMIVMDVDGVLTDSKVILGTNGIELKSFNSKDGYWIRIAQKAGLKLAIITGRESDIVSRRANELNIEDVHQGVLNKLEAYQKIIDKYGLKDDEIAYIGDDLVDLPVLTRVGLSVVVADALPDLKDRVDYVTKNSGGHGAVKEMIELILKSQNKLDSIINKHLLILEQNGLKDTFNICH